VALAGVVLGICGFWRRRDWPSLLADSTIVCWGLALLAMATRTAWGLTAAVAVAVGHSLLVAVATCAWDAKGRLRRRGAALAGGLLLAAVIAVALCPSSALGGLHEAHRQEIYDTGRKEVIADHAFRTEKIFGELGVCTTWLPLIVAAIVATAGALAVNVRRSLGLLFAAGALLGVVSLGVGLASQGVGASPYLHANYLGDGYAVAIFGTLHCLLAGALAATALWYVKLSGRPVASVEGLAGMGRALPGAAMAVVLAAMSLFGTPLTGGFWARVFLLGTTLTGRSPYFPMAAGAVWVVLAVGATRIILAMYPATPAPLPAPVEPLAGVKGQLLRTAITAIAVALIMLGLRPQLLMEPIRMLIR